MPYTFAVSFVVDLSSANITVDSATDTINVRLPSPKAQYQKLTVDEEKMQKVDWLYPLTPERYASIKNEIEQKLYTESATNAEYLQAAWENATKNMESMFKTVAEQSKDGVTCTIRVIRDDSLAAPAETQESPPPSAT